MIKRYQIRYINKKYCKNSKIFIQMFRKERYKIMKITKIINRLNFKNIKISMKMLKIKNYLKS